MSFFSLRKNSPLWWYHKSCDLRASAATLWFSMENKLVEKISLKLHLGEGRSVNTRPVYLMLCGLSLELMYKAILVTKEKKVPPKHILQDLANLAGITTEKSTEDLLSILTESIIWDGKYPVPKETQQNKMAELSGLENRNLVDYVERRGFEIPQPNDKLHWDFFNEIWKEANKMFWQNRC